MKHEFPIELIDDDTSKRILNVTKRFKTVSKISSESCIPISTVYRKIKFLQNLGVLQVRGFITNGVRYKKYKSVRMSRYGNYNARVKKIMNLVTSNPGISYNELQENSGMPNGTLSHYLSRMTSDEKIIAKRTTRRAWFFLPETNPLEMELIINLRKETSKNILSFLLLNGISSFTEIQKSTQKAPATISLTITQLVEIGLIRRMPGTRPKYELAHKELTLNWIKRLEPNTIDVMKERFADTFSYL